MDRSLVLATLGSCPSLNRHIAHGQGLITRLSVTVPELTSFESGGDNV